MNPLIIGLIFFILMALFGALQIIDEKIEARRKWRRRIVWYR